MANFTNFLPQAETWVSGLGLHPLYGHPHKAKKPKKIKIAKAHLKNHLLSHGKHPRATGGHVSIHSSRIRRSQAYSQK